MREGGIGRRIEAPDDAETCWALKAEKVNDWVRMARPGETIVYAGGPHLIRSAGVDAINKAGRDGLVRFNFRRSAGKGEYLATRLAAAARPATSPPTQPSPESERDYDDAALLMGLLCRLASNGRPCPQNRELGNMLGGVSPDRVSYLLRKNVTAGAIRIDALPRGGRVVTIAASGLTTARTE